MIESFTKILKNTGCSYCQENDSLDKKEFINNWSLYLKEDDMFSSLLLYNNKLNKDISYYLQKNDTIHVVDEKDNVLLQLDYISNYAKTNYALLVPSEDFIEYYENLEKKNTKIDENLKSYLLLDNCKIRLKP